MRNYLKFILFSGTFFVSVPVHAQSLLCANGPDIPGLLTGTESNSGQSAPVGTAWSEVQNETGNTTESNTLSGVSCSVTATVFRCADDFIVPAGGWDISGVATYAYQTGFTGETSPITAMTVSFYGPCEDGLSPGDVGCNVVAGDEVTNVLLGSTDISTFRIFNSAVPDPGTTPATNRKVWVNEASFDPQISFITPGRYWMEFNTSIDDVSGHFTPPITIPGVRGLPEWNAVQRIAGGVYQNVIDTGNPSTAPDFLMDFPFEIYGSGTPTPIGRTCTPSDIIFEDGFEATAP